jgi:predicted HTH domain antitoxin
MDLIMLENEDECIKIYHKTIQYFKKILSCLEPINDFHIFVKNIVMKGVINIQYPESLAISLKLQGKDFENEIKVSSLVKLYELGKISSGTAAKVLGIKRLDFLELLAKYKVSIIGNYSQNDLMEDIANA